MVPAQRAFALFLVVGLLEYVVFAHEENEMLREAPKLWGDPGFYVKFKELSVSEGVLKPKFDPDKTQYDITITNPTTKNLVFFFMLDLTKYDLSFCPTITFDGHEVKYEPIEGIQWAMPLDETINALDKTVAIKVFDPKKKASGWFAAEPAKLTYYVTVRQPPAFESIVDLANLSVVDNFGHTIESVEPLHLASHKVDFTYEIDKHVKNVTVNAFCHQKANNLTLNGDLMPFNEPMVVKTEMGETEVMVQCQYLDNEWTKDVKLLRAYVLKFRKKLTIADTEVTLKAQHPSPQCKLQDASDRSKGFACELSDEQVRLIGITSNNEAYLTLEPTGIGMPNGLPVHLYVPYLHDRNLTLVLRLGTETAKYPVNLHWPVGCPGVTCPSGWVSTTEKLVDCKEKICSLKNDMDECCHSLTLDHCDSVECLEPFELVPKARDVKCDTDFVEGKSTCLKEQCCQRVCTTVTCPRIWQHIPFADLLPCDQETNCTVSHCCERRCSSFDCGMSAVHVPYADTIACSEGKEDHCHHEQCCGDLPVCTGFECPFGTNLHSDAAHTYCFGKTCTKADVPRCCSSPSTCQDFECPAPHFQLRDFARSITCAVEECTDQDVNNCCRPQETCASFKCPAGMAHIDNADEVPCSTAKCTEDDEDACCATAATCASFQCPPHKELKDDAQLRSCHSVDCHSEDCCVGKGWMLAEEGQHCTAACHPVGGCVDDRDSWPSKVAEFDEIAASVGSECVIKQAGEASYDPSISENDHCGWKPYFLAPELELLPAYAHMRCNAAPPPRTRRFCLCGHATVTGSDADIIHT